jgi:hypothetical protein
MSETVWAAVLFGVVGPLVAVIVTAILVKRTWRARPELLTGLMVAGFAGKMMFFGVYVTVMLTVLSLPPTPFVVSFTASFIALYAIEAAWMQRLFADTPRS